MVFFPVDKHRRLQCEGIVERIGREEGLTVLGWRDTPCDGDAIGREARATQPYIQQIFSGRPEAGMKIHFERKLYVTRKRIEHEIAIGRSRTVTSSTFRRSRRAPLSTKACCWRRRSPTSMASWRIPGEERDLRCPSAFFDEYFPQLAAGASVSLHRAQWRDQYSPRQCELDEGARIAAAIAALRRGHQKAVSDRDRGGSDSAAFDSAVELLFQSGRSLPHVMAMLIPEAWSGNPHIDPDRAAFYEYHASLMEPWDGPAAMAFTDGRVIGAMLDRNGLRPGALCGDQ